MLVTDLPEPSAMTDIVERVATEQRELARGHELVPLNLEGLGRGLVAVLPRRPTISPYATGRINAQLTRSRSD
jgi:hypothetical protein